MIIVTGAGGFLGQHVMRMLPGAVADDREMCAGLRDTVVHLAAVCGGIGLNKSRNVRMLTDNLRIGLDAFDRHGDAERHIYAGAACMYPRICEVPFRERDIWAGLPEPTNAPYGIAKRTIGEAFLRIGGMVLAFANLYGPGDHYEPECSHVIPALIRRLTDARDAGERTVTLWGNGMPTRDFLYVEDAALAVVAGIHHYQPGDTINAGTGIETSISALATMVAEAVGYDGAIEWSDDDRSGQPRRVLSTDRARGLLGWTARTSLTDGIARAVEDYLCRRR